MWSQCIRFDSPSEAVEDLELAELAAEEGDSSPKARGTAMHKALASLFGAEPDVSRALLDALSESEREQVQWCAEQIVEIAAGHGWARESIQVEQRVTVYKGESFEVLYFGTLDAETKGGPLIFDAKFGLERQYFPQHVGYALAKMERDSLNRVLAFTLYGRRRRVQSYVINRETAELVAYGLLRRRHAGNGRPTPCEFCSWCSHKHECSALAAPGLELVEAREDWPMKLPQAHISRIGSDPRVMGLALYLWRTFMKNWGEGAEFYAKAMAERGIVPLGFKKQARKGSATITSVTAALRQLEAAGVPREALDGAIKTSMGALAKAYGEAFGLGESAARGKVKNLLLDAGLVAEGEPTFALVKEKDAEAVLRAALPQPEPKMVEAGQPVQVNDLEKDK